MIYFGPKKVLMKVYCTFTIQGSVCGRIRGVTCMVVEEHIED